MRDAGNILQVAARGPHYMGFIFYEKSPRFVGHDFRLPALPADVRAVGVFVNAPVEKIVETARALSLDYVQLHGDETVADCRTLKAAGIGVIKVFSIDDHIDWARMQAYKSVVDFFLFDTKGKYYGGNAVAFDWKLLAGYDQEIPFFLSGGLSPENIAGVRELQHMNLHAVDVNSGVEDSPGVKNIGKLYALQEKLEKMNTDNTHTP